MSGTPLLDRLDSLDARIRAALVADPRVSHALAYGSRTGVGTGGRPLSDGWSDLEYWAFVEAPLDPFAFVEALTPVALAAVNAFGTPNVVTPDLIRVELHVEPPGRLAEVATWPGGSGVPERMLVKDRDGALRSALARMALNPPFVATLPPPQDEYDSLLNALVFGSAVLARGEEARAWEQMFWVRGGLLRLMRAAHGAPQPPSPSRRAEHDLPGRWQEALRATAPADVGAYTAAVHTVQFLAHLLALDSRPAVLTALTARLDRLHPRWGKP